MAAVTMATVAKKVAEILASSKFETLKSKHYPENGTPK